MSIVALLEATPRRAADGVDVPVRLCWNARSRADFLGQQWYPGLVSLPSFETNLGFDGYGYGLGATPTVGQLAIGIDPVTAPLASLIWKNAPLVLRTAPWPAGGAPVDPGDGDFTVAWTGKADTLGERDGLLGIVVLDPGQALRAAVQPVRFGTSGDALLDGADAKDHFGEPVPLGWGDLSAVPGLLVDRTYGIYLFLGRPATSVVSFQDGGFPFDAGVARAGLAALRANVPAAGACDYCLDAGGLTLARPWTAPTYPFIADLVAGSNKPGDIAAAIVAGRSTLSFRAGAIAAFNAAAPAPAQLYVDDGQSVADALDRLFPPLGAFWKLTSAGTIDVRRLQLAGAPTRDLGSPPMGPVSRLATVMPTGRRTLGYATNNHPLSESEIAKALLEGVAGPPGTDGAPGAPGADGVTYYSWIAFADAPDGTVNFTNGPPEGRAYIGRSDGRTTATESTSPADYQWNSYKGPPNFGIVANGGVVIASNKIISLATLDGTTFTGGAYSSEAYSGACQISFHALQSGRADLGEAGRSCGFMFGLNDDPAASNNWPDLNWAWHPYEDGTCGIYASGANLWTSPANYYGPATVFQIRYTGKVVEFVVDGTVVRSVATTAGQRFWFDSVFRSPNTGGELVSFGASGVPGTDGAPGTAGVPGAPGANGVTSYTWIAYADAPDGAVNFTTGAPGGRGFIGVAANKPTSVEGTDPTAYQWSQYTGPPSFGLVNNGGGIVIVGNRIIARQDGPVYPNFTAGAYSSESYVGAATISFRAANPGVAFLVGFNTDPTTGNTFQELDYAIHCYENGTFGVYGSGNNYYISPANAYNAATVFQLVYDGVSRVQAIAGGNLVYTFTGVAAGLRLFLDTAFRGQTNGAVANEAIILGFNAGGKAGVDGTNGVPGAPGANGAPSYTWVAYANHPSGLIDFTNGAPAGRAYIGLAANRSTATESSNPADYTWSQYKGPVNFGIVGQSCIVAGNLIIKDPAVGAGWGNGGAYSSEGFLNGAFVSFKAFGEAELMVGLNADPAAGAGYADIDVAFYLAPNGSYYDLRVNGATVGGGGTWSGEWTWTIVYDGIGYVRWFVNGGLVGGPYPLAAGLTMYMDSSIQTAGGRWQINGFGPAAKSGIDGATGSPGTPGAPGAAGSPGAQGPAGITVPAPVAINVASGASQLPTAVFVAAGASVTLVARVQVNQGPASASASVQIQSSRSTSGVWTAVPGASDSNSIPPNEGLQLDAGGTFTNGGAAGLFDFRAVTSNPIGSRTVDGRSSYLRVTS